MTLSRSIRTGCMGMMALALMGVLVLQGGGAFAAEGTVKPGKVLAGSTVYQEIVEKLSSADAAVRQQAMEDLRARAISSGSAVQMRQVTKMLLANKKYDEAAEVATLGITLFPGATLNVENLLTTKIRAELAGGKAQQALADAKSLFNVCSMEQTSEAILLVAEALVAANPNDHDVYDKFKEQQQAGAVLNSANPPTTQQLSAIAPANAPANGNLIRAIKIDAAPYVKAMETAAGEDYTALLGRANLLLMADRPQEAHALFNRMYSIARNSDLLEASEAIARCIRAEDGTIGRANAWVLAIRPKKTATSAPAATKP